MARHFMAGVGTAELFTADNQLFATAKTLTDSSITVGVQAEEVRAGAGAALRGKFYHSTTFDLTLTDAIRL